MSILGLLPMLGAPGYFASLIAQVNMGWSFASILGLLHMLGVLGFFGLSIAQVIVAVRSQQITDMVPRIPRNSCCG